MVRHEPPAALVGLPEEMVGATVASDQLRASRGAENFPLGLKPDDQLLSPWDVKGSDVRGEVVERPGGLFCSSKGREDTLNGISHGGGALVARKNKAREGTVKLEPKATEKGRIVCGRSRYRSALLVVPTIATQG